MKKIVKTVTHKGKRFEYLGTDGDCWLVASYEKPEKIVRIKKSEAEFTPLLVEDEKEQ